MFLFFSISPRIRRHGFVSHHCTVHGGEAWHELVTQRSYVTLFFILRLLPVGAAHYLLTCTTCGATWRLPRAEAAALAEQARGDVQGAGRSRSVGDLSDRIRAWTTPPAGAWTTPPDGPATRHVRAERLDRP